MQMCNRRLLTSTWVLNISSEHFCVSSSLRSLHMALWGKLKAVIAQIALSTV